MGLEEYGWGKFKGNLFGYRWWLREYKFKVYCCEGEGGDVLRGVLLKFCLILCCCVGCCFYLWVLYYLVDLRSFVWDVLLGSVQ